MKITLQKPVQFGEDTITELEFREATTRDFRDVPISNTTIGDFINVAARLCGRPPSVMDKLSPADMSEVTKFVGNLFGSGPETGEKD